MTLQILSSGGDGGAEAEYFLIKALGKIGGEVASRTLAEVLTTTHYPARTIQALFKTHADGPSGLDLTLLRECNVEPVNIAKGLGSWDIEDFQGRERVSREFTDEEILARLIDNADSISSSSVSPIIRHELLRAIARFELPEATSFLERASADKDDLTALQLLAASGDGNAIQQIVELELAEYEKDDRMGVVDRLMRWPKNVVRRAILSKLDATDQVARWLALLSEFALPADAALFARYEQSEDADIADVAHNFLTSEIATQGR